MIKRIELINFMSHRHTVIEPSEGLTVLVGPNNCGKSAFVTALQLLCHNSNSGFVIRHGEKRCDVIVETDQGNVVQWSRKKNGSAAYIIDGQPFDRLRGKVPEELHKVLRMPKVECDSEDFDIHFGEQTEPVFLLRNRGKAAAQFFASSSDATHLVAMQGLHKSKVTVAKRDATRLSDRKAILDSQLNSLDPLESIEVELADCERQHKELMAKDEDIEQLKIIIAAIKDSVRKADLLGHKSKCLASLKGPPAIADTRPLLQLTRGIRDCESRRSRASRFAEQLVTVEPPPSLTDCVPLMNLVKALNQVQLDAMVLTSRLDCFENFAEPPKLKDSASLESLYRSIVRAERKLEHSAHQSACYKDLAPPELLGDERSLDSLIAKFKAGQLKVRQFDRCVKELDGLPTPPVQRDESTLADWVDRCRVQSIKLEEKNKQVADSEASLNVVTVELEHWVCENPVCPTCGGPTNKQQLLEKIGGQDV